jgi:hypothetical protein
VRIFPILIAAALCLPVEGADLLPRIREKMADVLQRQPNYTCTETIERTRQEIGNRARIEDTLRLEVALVDGKEMFAWPGSKQFEDRELGELVSTGMFGNGNFAIYARILFLSNVAVIADRGETELGGRPALRYDFRVSKLTSGHKLRVNGREAIVGFHGSFYADPVTLDVRRVEVVAEDIPPDLGLFGAETSVDYGRIQIGDGAFLLPSESQIMMSTPDAVSRNSIRFSSCQRFAGETKLSFDDPVLTEVFAPAPRSDDVQIPAGLPLQLETQELNLMQAAVGDSIRATLRSDLKDHRQLLAPKGSIANGRIVRLDRLASSFVLQVEFHDLEWPGGHARLKLSLDRVTTLTRLITQGRGDSEVVISRQAGPRISGILMVWRTE